MKWVFLAIGGVAGTFCRYGLSQLIHKTAGTAFPYGTLTVNLLGCFVIGVLASLADRSVLSPEMRLLWMAGFCGAFTTFSAFIFESSDLLKEGDLLKASLYVVLSVLLGFLVFRAGGLAAKAI